VLHNEYTLARGKINARRLPDCLNQRVNETLSRGRVVILLRELNPLHKIISEGGLASFKVRSVQHLCSVRVKLRVSDSSAQPGLVEPVDEKACILKLLRQEEGRAHAYAHLAQAGRIFMAIVKLRCPIL